jgi:hypothetical protein
MPRFYDPFTVHYNPPMNFIIHFNTSDMVVIESNDEWIWRMWDEAICMINLEIPK